MSLMSKREMCISRLSQITCEVSWRRKTVLFSTFCLVISNDLKCDFIKISWKNKEGQHLISDCYVPSFMTSNLQRLSILNHPIFPNKSHEFHSVGEIDSERLSSFWASMLNPIENENLIIQISISRSQIKSC